MIDKSIVESKYKSLSDEQLLHLFEHEIAELTPAARTLLTNELKNRNIDILSRTIQQYPYEQNTIEIHQLPLETQVFISDNIEKGEDGYFLIGGLIERGLNEDSAKKIIKSLHEFYLKQHKKSTDELLRSISFFVAGLAIHSLPLNQNKHLAIIIIAYSLITIGFIKLVHELQKRKRLKKLLELSNKMPVIPIESIGIELKDDSLT